MARQRVPTIDELGRADYLVDVSGIYCFVIARSSAEQFLEIARIIEESATVRELATRVIEAKVDDVLEEVFVVDSIGGLIEEAEDLFGIPSIDVEWDPDSMLTYRVIPDVRFYIWGCVPPELEDLQVEHDIDEGWDYPYIPAESAVLAFARMDAAGTEYEVVPDLFDTLMVLPRGGELA